MFDEQEDEWSNLFLLEPVAPEPLALALEKWEIWKRWEKEGTMATFPALPADRERYEQLKNLLKGKFKTDPATSHRVQG